MKRNDLLSIKRSTLSAAVLGGLVTLTSNAATITDARDSAANPAPIPRTADSTIWAACNPCNPCKTSAGNPCAASNPCNPCAACNPCNPCAATKIDPSEFVRPAGVSVNPCGANLVAEGKLLWNDPKLSTNDLACGSCHDGGALFNASFEQPYPHKVAMPHQRAGVDKVTVDEMVQFCMVVPMQQKALPWNSRELAALSAYSLELQKNFSFNPCAASPNNPCAAANPCNPCAASN